MSEPKSRLHILTESLVPYFSQKRAIYAPENLSLEDIRARDGEIAEAIARLGIRVAISGTPTGWSIGTNSEAEMDLVLKEAFGMEKVPLDYVYREEFVHADPVYMHAWRDSVAYAAERHRAAYQIEIAGNTVIVRLGDSDDFQGFLRDRNSGLFDRMAKQKLAFDRGGPGGTDLH